MEKPRDFGRGTEFCGLFYLWIVLVPYIAAVFVNVALFYVPMGTARSYIVMSVSAAVLQVFGLWFIKKTSGVALSGTRDPSIGALYAGFSSGVFGYIPLMVISGLCSYLSSPTPGAFNVIESLGFIPAFLTVALIPCILEELICRGAIFGIFRPAGAKRAIFWSALCFAILHGDLGTMVYAFIFGLLAGYLRERTGSVVPGMFTHGLINTITVCRVFTEINDISGGSGFLFFLEILISAAFLFIGLRMFLKGEPEEEMAVEPKARTSALFYILFALTAGFEFFFR